MEDIKLIHGDSLQALKGYGDNHFDVAIVDPPYAVGDTFRFGSSGLTIKTDNVPNYNKNDFESFCWMTIDEFKNKHKKWG